MERIKQGFVAHVKGHKNSKGESAEWVIKDHTTGKILSSHTSESEAKKHLQDMHVHSGKFYEEVCFMKLSNINNLDELLKKAEVEKIDLPKDELQSGVDVEKEHTDTIKSIYVETTGEQPTKDELMDAFKSIVNDHEVETVDSVGEPVYYEDYLLPMEDEMKSEGKKEAASEDDTDEAYLWISNDERLYNLAMYLHGEAHGDMRELAFSLKQQMSGMLPKKHVNHVDWDQLARDINDLFDYEEVSEEEPING